MDNHSPILPRDKLLRDTFTPAETSLYALILITANVAFWLADPRSYWLLGFFLIAAAITPIILKTHEYSHPFFVSLMWPKFWLCSAPVWLLCLQFYTGLVQQPLGNITVDGVNFVQLEVPEHNWLPASTSATTTWPVVMGLSAIYIVTLGLFIVPKSRAFFARLMPYLCLSATLVGLFGYVQHSLNLADPLFTKGTGAEDFLGFFPYDGHWAAFAILWTCATISMSLLKTGGDDSPPFVRSSGPWYLAGGTIFGVSAFLVEARWPAIFLTLTYALMMFIFALHFLKQSKDPNRKTISVISGLISLGMLTAGLHRIFHPTTSTELTKSLQQSAWEMFLDRPVFGWGMDSFGHILPYYGSDLLIAENYDRAGSDALQFLAELGVIGVIPPVALLSFLIFKYLKGRHDIQFTNHLFIGVAVTLLLGFFDSPFMSPAVIISFFIMLFIALRWADVSRNEADQVDAPDRPNLVTPQSLRRVPFHPIQNDDKFK